ncbi:MAG: multidrug effflux MFS transporter [Sterolibacteriaceae bacterium MAG5]|nr:multidrug effflux MFS transporter [Candidatus Nitricoxidireducens bremensis]
MATAPRGLAPLLAALAAIGPFSIDTYLPAFPAMGESLGASPVAVQQTLTAYLITFAFMMLWHGALSDALGRRRVLLWAHALYTLASLFCAFATSIEMLWLGRALQGLSAGAGMVVGRAIVRDVLDGPAAQRLIAHIGMMFALAPAVAPVLGGWVHAFFDWHAIFVFLALYGTVLFLAIYRYLPETLPPEQRQSLRPGPLLRAYREVFSHRGFLALAGALALNFNGFFLYVLSAPAFLMGHLGVSPQGFLWLFGPAMVGMVVGNFLSARLAGEVSPGRTIALGYGLMLAAAAANVGVNLAMEPRLPWAVLPVGLYVVGVALAMPSLTLRILDLFPQRLGLISSCQGVTQTAVNALTAALLAPLAWGSALTMAWAMAAFLLLGLAAFALRR